MQLTAKTIIPTTVTLSKWVNAFSEAETKGAKKDSICPVSSKRFKQKDCECSDSFESIRSSELQKKQRLSNSYRSESKESLSPSKGLRHESAEQLELTTILPEIGCSWLFIAMWIFYTRHNRCKLLRLCWHWAQYSLMM